MISCVPRIPTESIGLSRNVNKGIEVLGNNGITIINAWEQASLSVISHQWNEIYERAEKAYWDKKTIPESGIPTPQQYSEIAALASSVQIRLGDKVRTRAEEMKKTVLNNTNSVKNINLQVTELLSSATRVIEMNEALTDSIKDIIPLPLDLLDERK